MSVGIGLLKATSGTATSQNPSETKKCSEWRGFIPFPYECTEKWKKNLLLTKADMII